LEELQAGSPPVTIAHTDKPRAIFKNHISYDNVMSLSHSDW